MEIALKIKAKNGILQRFIDKMGWTQSDFARNTGLSPTSVGKYFNMTGCPSKKMMKKVCELVGETEEAIFPQVIRKKDFLELDKSITYYKEVDPERLLGGETFECLPAPEEEESDILLHESIGNLHDALETLTYREREILIGLYGLNGNPKKTHKELGEDFNVCRGRVGQIEQRAVQKLRHPVRSRHLEGFLSS